MTITAQIGELIDKLDGSEIVRDRIAEILLVESLSQQTAAALAAKDPALWKLRVFSEASNPWAEFDVPEDGGDPVDTSPIVNVWYDSSTFDKSKGNVVARQQADGVFFVDCYGYGVARDETSGHTPGDQLAALEAHRALRLVRNILMAGHYTYLGFPKTDCFIGSRWTQSINVFQPTAEGKAVQKIVAARLTLAVSFNEVSPQVIGLPVTTLSISVRRDTVTGEVLFTETVFAPPTP